MDGTNKKFVLHRCGDVGMSSFSHSFHPGHSAATPYAPMWAVVTHVQSPHCLVRCNNGCARVPLLTFLCWHVLIFSRFSAPRLVGPDWYVISSTTWVWRWTNVQHLFSAPSGSRLTVLALVIPLTRRSFILCPNHISVVELRVHVWPSLACFP